jgi:hypothetical protein
VECPPRCTAGYDEFTKDIIEGAAMGVKTGFTIHATKRDDAKLVATTY